jgi:hypothetical protein
MRMVKLLLNRISTGIHSRQERSLEGIQSSVLGAGPSLWIELVAEPSPSADGLAALPVPQPPCGVVCLR